MEVFALDMAVRETGAATMERSLGKMRAEAQKTAETAGRVGNSMGKMGAQIVAAGRVSAGGITSLTHAVGDLALNMGPTGILAVAVGGLVVMWRRAFTQMAEDVKKAQLEMLTSTQRMFAMMSAAARESDLKGVGEAIKQVRTGEAFVIGQEQLKLLPEQQLKAALLERGLTRLREEYAKISGVITQAAEDERLWTESSVNRTSERAARMRENRDVLKQLRPLALEYRLAIDVLSRTEGVLVERERELLGVQAQRIAQSNADVRATAERIAAINREATAILNREKIRAMEPAGLPRGFGNVPPLFTPEQIAEATRLAEMQDTFAAGIAAAIVGGFSQGISEAIASGSIGAGFAALTGTLLAGLGNAMVEFGTASLLTAKLMETIKASLASFLPGGAIGASIAMIALGSAIGGVARRAFGGQGGGGVSGFRTPTASSQSNEPTPTNLLFGPTSANVAAGVSPMPFMNFTVIGPNDPVAQRTIEELIAKSQRRGTL